MAPEIRDLLNVANLHDAATVANQVKLAKVIAAGAIVPTIAPPVSELKLLEEDEDPFNGNINNRNVAKRIARMSGRKFLNTTQPTHIGDPNKAAADVAKSEKVNPDPTVEDEDDDEPVNAKPPSPNSPAAKKAAAEAAAKATAAASGQAGNATDTSAKPPEWKANAS